MKYNSKLILGTAQFGLDYGVNNKRGRIPEKEVTEIIKQAWTEGIDLLDTAFSYGESERVIGRYLRSSSRSPAVVSKLPDCTIDEIMGYFYKSLAFLNIDSFYGYLLHDFQTYKRDSEVWWVLEELNKRGKTNKIGFSLYYPEELELLLDRKVRFDLIQVPFSVLDRRFENKFTLLKDRGVEIHVRSVFLQGLVFKSMAELTGRFIKVKKKICQLQMIANAQKTTVAAICLNYVLSNKKIDRVVVGVDSLEHLNEVIRLASEMNLDKDVFQALEAVRENDEGMLLPFNWSSATAGSVS